MAGNAGADVTAAFAFGLGLGAAARAVARQAVKLRIQAARLELLPAARLLAPLPPVAFLRRLWDCLGTGFGLGDFGPLIRFVLL